MSFTNAKLLNESFSRIHLTESVNTDEEIITLRELDNRINECKSKLVSIKEHYDDIKSTWKALCEDKASYAFNESFSNTSLSESFNKAIEDLKMEYEDTKTTLQFYKDVKNKALLEAEVTIPKDQLMDPDRPISISGLARDAVKKEKDLEIQRQKEAEKEKARAEAKPLLDTIANIEAESADSFFDELFGILVPPSGKASTQAGELLRAVGKIIYRDYNDGDKFYQGYGLETCGPAAAFLMDNGYWDDFERIVDQVTGYGEMDDDRYTKAIEEIRDKIIDDVQDIDLLSQPPVMDMLDADTSWLEDNQPRYEVEVWASDDLEAHIDAGNVDSWKIIEFLEDNALSWNSEFRGAEVSRPWGHHDTSYTITNLTIDGKEMLEDSFNKDIDGFWGDLVNELNEEYPLDSDEEDDEEDSYETEDEDLDESFLCEAVLMETGDEDLLTIFMELYREENVMKARVDRILEEYREYKDQLPEDLFKAASIADQARIIELLQK